MQDFVLVKLLVNLGFALLKKKATDWVSRFVLAGPFGFALGYFIELFLNNLVKLGIMHIDIFVAEVKLHMSEKEFNEFVKTMNDKIVKEAGKRIYTEAEKNEIRRQYKDAIRRFGSLGAHRL